jgi:hypothetical protein
MTIRTLPRAFDTLVAVAFVLLSLTLAPPPSSAPDVPARRPAPPDRLSGRDDMGRSESSNAPWRDVMEMS